MSMVELGSAGENEKPNKKHTGEENVRARQLSSLNECIGARQLLLLIFKNTIRQWQCIFTLVGQLIPVNGLLSPARTRFMCAMCAPLISFAGNSRRARYDYDCDCDCHVFGYLYTYTVHYIYWIGAPLHAQLTIDVYIYRCVIHIWLYILYMRIDVARAFNTVHSIREREQIETVL